jgi:hypothetical protein
MEVAGRRTRSLIVCIDTMSDERFPPPNDRRTEGTRDRPRHPSAAAAAEHSPGRHSTSLNPICAAMSAPILHCLCVPVIVFLTLVLCVCAFVRRCTVLSGRARARGLGAPRGAGRRSEEMQTGHRHRDGATGTTRPSRGRPLVPRALVSSGASAKRVEDKGIDPFASCLRSTRSTM